MIYLITYDLIKPGQDYTDLIAEIKRLDPYGWVKPCESTWIVKSNLEVQQIVNTLKAVDATDKLLVVSASAPWWSEGMGSDVLSALHSKLG